MTKNCTTCANCLFQDEGYSNYTVEGTQFICMLDKHPDGRFDRWYGKDDRLNYAEHCGMYEVGEPVSLDVEHEDKSELSADQSKRYYAWTKREYA